MIRSKQLKSILEKLQSFSLYNAYSKPIEIYSEEWTLGSCPQFCWADSAVETKELVVAEKKKKQAKTLYSPSFSKRQKDTG